MLSDRVRCQVCGRWLKALAFAHLRRHGMTGDEYKKRYGVDFLVSDTLRVQNSRRHRRSGRSTYEPLHRAEILKRIADMDARGQPLRPTVMTAKRQLPLVTMAERVFGTWRAAVAAAGVDYAKHIRRTWWNPSKVISRIRERHRKGQILAYTAVEREEPSLISAAYYYFGSWARAVKRSGLPAECGRSTRKWSRASIIAEIVKRHSQGAPLNVASVQAEFLSLVSAALRVFGTWDTALKASGLRPRDIRKSRFWNRKLLVAEIRRMRRAGEGLNAGRVRKGKSVLITVARNHFGSWDNALRAAGFDPAEIRERRPARVGRSGGHR